MYELGDRKVTDATYEEALQEVMKEEEPYFQTKVAILGPATVEAVVSRKSIIA